MALIESHLEILEHDQFVVIHENKGTFFDQTLNAFDEKMMENPLIRHVEFPGIYYPCYKTLDYSDEGLYASIFHDKA